MAREDNYIGRQIGNYRIVEELASGSFGRVYKGVHIYLTKRVVAIKVRRYREALQAYERALQLNPQFVKAFNNRGVTLYELRYYEDALTAHDQAIALQPNKAISHYYRSRALKQLGKLEEAQRAYEKARQFGYAG